MNDTFNDLRLAKTDYIISKLRSLLDAPFEYTLDWQSPKAFNGCLLSNSKDTLQALFFSADRRVPDTSRGTIGLQDMTVSVYVREDSMLKRSELNLDPMLLQAQAEFDDLMSKHANKIVGQIARLHFHVRCKATVTNAIEACDATVRAVAASLEGVLIMEPKHEDNWFVSDIDPAILNSFTSHVEKEAELILAEPLQIESVACQLRSKIASLGNELFGLGQTLVDSDSSLLLGDPISSIGIFARHF